MLRHCKPASRVASFASVLLSIGLSSTCLADSPCTCVTDLSADGATDGADLGLLLAQWSGQGAADLDGSGVVDGADLGLLLASWGPCMGPHNDECISAAFLDSLEAIAPFCTIGATDSLALEPFAGCGPQPAIHNDLWYTCIAAVDGTLEIDTCGSGDLDTVIAVYAVDGGMNCACPAEASIATLIACSDDACEMQSRLEIPALAGQCFKLRVGTFTPAPGEGVLRVRMNVWP